MDSIYALDKDECQAITGGVFFALQKRDLQMQVSFFIELDIGIYKSALVIRAFSESCLNGFATKCVMPERYA